MANWPATKIATWLGILTAILSICGTIYVNIDKWIVTDAELKSSEERIIKKVELEAVKTRMVYIDEMIERKLKLELQLEDETNPGKISQIIEQIKKLNARIEKLRGK